MNPSLFRPRLSLSLFAGVFALAAGCASTPPPNPGYPTADRVTYVQECMNENPGPAFEMRSKCVCAIDRMAERVPHAEFVEMSTAFNANSIGGERGSYVRDVAVLQADIKRWRELQASVKQACFIGAGPR
jgi:hypothetical protein